jgi:hypothetical protein
MRHTISVLVIVLTGSSLCLSLLSRDVLALSFSSRKLAARSSVLSELSDHCYHYRRRRKGGGGYYPILSRNERLQLLLLGSKSSSNNGGSRRDILVQISTTSSLFVRTMLTVAITARTAVVECATATDETNVLPVVVQPKQKRPARAPISYLIPATAVRERVKSLVDIMESIKANSNVNKKKEEDDATVIQQILKELTLVLSTPELIDTRKTRKAFDTYTDAIQFNADSFTLNLPLAERKAFIRNNDSLLTASNAIISDLDLRDLHRNEVLSLLQDVSAEVKYQQFYSSKPTSSTSRRRNADNYNPECTLVDLSDLKLMIQTLDQECTAWFDLIPPEDVLLAYQTYVKQRS